MAEAVAVIALIGNIAQLTEFSIVLFSRLKSFLSKSAVLPPTLHNLSLTLPLLQTVTRSIYGRAQQHAFGQDTQNALSGVLVGLEAEVQELNGFLSGLLPREDESKFAKSVKAFQSMKAGKEVEERRRRIDTLVGSLNVFLSVSNNEGIGVLVEAAGAGRTDQTLGIEQRQRVWMVDYDREEDFVGREKIMQEIQGRFDKGVRRVAVVGIGGVGKSRIAIEHCHEQQQKQEDTDIFWVNGGSRTKFEEAYRRIARLRDMPGREDKDIDILDLVRTHLAESASEPWLMVLDNADNRDDWLQSASIANNAPLIEHLPRCDHGRLLITTRDSQLGLRLTEGKLEPLQISRFGPEEANRLLRAKIADGHILEDRDATELTAALEHLPLTITQAAAYLSQIDMSATEYLATFRAGLSDIPELLTESIDDPARDRGTSNSVFQAWRLSFEQISRQSPRAAELLSLMSMLDRQEIPQSLLKTKGESPLQFRAAMAKLKAFSFVTEDRQTSRYSMHRLVQLSTQRWIEMLGKKLDFAELAVAMIARSCPPDADFQYWPVFIELQPHVNLALEYSLKSMDAIMNRATILNMFGRYSIGRARFDVAVKFLDEARLLRLEHLGPEHEDTLTAKGQHGVACGMLGKPHWPQARRIQEEVLVSCLATLGPNHPLTLKTRSRVAINLSKFREYDMAVAQHKTNLAAMQTHLGPTHRYTLSELSQLLYTLNRIMRWREALEVGKLALELRTETLGPEHPDTATIMAQLGVTYSGLRQFSEAAELEEKVLDLRMKALGPEHPKTLLAMEKLSQTFARQGRNQEAEGLLSWIVEAKTKTLGSEHHSVITAEKLLAKVRLAKQQLQSQKLHDASAPPGEHTSHENSKSNAAEGFGHEDKKSDGEEATSQSNKIAGSPAIDATYGLENAFAALETNAEVSARDDNEEPPPPYSETAGP